MIVFQHGDDIAALGEESALDDLEKGLGKNMLLKQDVMLGVGSRYP